MTKLPRRLSPDDIKLVSLDGELTWKLRCPGCGHWGYIDDEQFYGRVSMKCERNCTFHETRDLSEVMPTE